jgi:hypothetical protein
MRRREFIAGLGSAAASPIAAHASDWRITVADKPPREIQTLIDNHINAFTIDARTTRHPGYAVSQQKRKRTEEPFGWARQSAGSPGRCCVAPHA